MIALSPKRVRRMGPLSAPYIFDADPDAVLQTMKNPRFDPRRLGRGHACLRQAKRGRQVDEAQRIIPQRAARHPSGGSDPEDISIAGNKR